MMIVLSGFMIGLVLLLMHHDAHRTESHHHGFKKLLDKVEILLMTTYQIY